MGDVQVHANELVFASDRQGRSTGDVAFSIQSPLDKGRAFASLLDGKGPSGQQNDAASCFVGDSITDLIPLLLADYGIVLGKSSSLKDTAQAFGVKILPLTCASLERVGGISKNHRLPHAEGDVKSRLQASKGVLYTAESWLEMKAFLFGHQDLLGTE